MIKPGSSGQFDVCVDGEVIFSKATQGRFPNEGEIERCVAALREGKQPPPLDPPGNGFIGRILEKLRS